MGLRHMVLRVVPAPAEVVEGLAAGIREAEDAGGLVEALAGGVVARGAEDADVRVVADVGYERVAAGNRKAEEGRLELREGKVVRGDVAADVVDGYERHAEPEGEALRKVDADEQRADEPGRERDGDGVYVGAGQPRDGERAVRELVDDLDVAAGGNLGHDAAVHGVEVGLGEDLVGQHFAAVADKGDGGFVTGGFNGENYHSCTSYK